MKKTLSAGIAVTLALMFNSCEKETVPAAAGDLKDSQLFVEFGNEKGTSCITDEEEPVDPSDYEGSVVLGAEKKIPQTIENMQSAWEKLKERGLYPGMEDPVKVNRLYVRFLPKDRAQLDMMKPLTCSIFRYITILSPQRRPTTGTGTGHCPWRRPTRCTPWWTVTTSSHRP